MKLCANHYIRPEINFTRHPQDQKVCMWNARDFANMDADTASVNGCDELFMARFKTEDISNQFNRIIKDSLDKTEANVAKTSSGKPKPVVKTEEKKQIPMKLLSGPKQGAWDCDACCLQVSPELTVCPACQTAKPGTESSSVLSSLLFKTSTPSSVPPKPFVFGLPSVSGETASLDKLKPKQGSWDCKACSLQVTPNKTNCPACQAAKPGSENVAIPPTCTYNVAPTKSTFVFGMPSASPKTTFSFGTPILETKPSFVNSPTPTVEQRTPPTNQPQKPAGAFASLNFNRAPDSGRPTYNFGLIPSGSSLEKPTTVSPVKPVSQKLDVDADEDDDEVKQADQSQLNFTPIIDKLPDQVVIQTGEEQEEVIFEARAKLYRYLASEGWKERGLGQLKLLRSPTTTKVRVVMRREQVLKVCCNHYITKEMKLEPQGSTDIPVWIWWCVDVSEELEGAKETFSVRFKTAEDSQAFHDAFMEAVKAANEGSSEGSSPPTSAKEMPKADEVNSDEDDLVIVDESPVSLRVIFY